MPKSVIQLNVLRRLVDELEASLKTADTHTSRPEGQEDFIVEMSKATGLASGIMQEASMLVMDISMAIKLETGPASPGLGIDLSMPPIKGSGNAN